MDLATEDGLNPQLLFVSRDNLAQVVARIAPNMVLVDRTEFAGVAEAMLTIMEKATP